MKIPNETFQKTAAWIKRNARPLETARWEYFFENGSADKVIHYLSVFQNEDGGFGHGLEPDFWLPHSSAIATWAAGQILMEIGVSSQEKIMQSLLSYLADTYDHEAGLWQTVHPKTNDYLHAPWWHWKERVQENWMYNPSVELAAFFVQWSPEESENSRIGWEVLKYAVNHLMNSQTMDSHEINNFQQLVKIMKPYEQTFNSKLNYSFANVTGKVMLLAADCIEKDVSEWSIGYKPLPLDFIDGPEHPLCKKFGDLVEQNLQFYVDQLSDDGIWDISWNWGNYPEAYAVARQQWKGILAVDRYKLLQSFGCL
ncbi:hypothetical protein [Virgibacillus ihumii]|uniref:hypothetical protein n=1 Tax=Virgibacillus ihumii TaxID=2686091 RepID=UPI00157C18F7|nr:hypothetical protein [Virgibacillus ihumii]